MAEEGADASEMACCRDALGGLGAGGAAEPYAVSGASSSRRLQNSPVSTPSCTALGHCYNPLCRLVLASSDNFNRCSGCANTDRRTCASPHHRRHRLRTSCHGRRPRRRGQQPDRPPMEPTDGHDRFSLICSSTRPSFVHLAVRLTTPSPCLFTGCRPLHK